jgi:hypothetical protein
MAEQTCSVQDLGSGIRGEFSVGIVFSQVFRHHSPWKHDNINELNRLLPHLSTRKNRWSITPRWQPSWTMGTAGTKATADEGNTTHAA